MSEQTQTGDSLGINGLGRIGKLTLWHHVARKHFGQIAVNVGRQVGSGLDTICQVIEKDSSYGRMHHFLFGINAEPCIRIIDPERNLLEVAGVPVTVLQEARNPRDIAWREHRARVVVDTTGIFGDPTRPADDGAGSIRGHLEAGAEKVLNSSAFKIKDSRLSMPDDVVTLIYGINQDAFDPDAHDLISAASCTTTGLAHMVRPLLDRLPASSIMTAGMSTIHAATNTQTVLDSMPKAGATDLRKSRSVLNNIILTSTNAAKALEQVIPEIKDIGFMADSVRIPTPTVSLIILNLAFQTRGKEILLNREVINGVYKDAAESGPQQGLLVYTEEQNAPLDMVGMRAAVVIEAHETHTRTGFVNVDLTRIPGIEPEMIDKLPEPVVHVPVTHAKLFGWYDNEYGSYTNMLGELTVHVHRAIG